MKIENSLKNLYFDMEMEVMNIIDDFVDENFYDKFFSRIEEKLCIKYDGDYILEIVPNDIIIYYLCKKSLSEKEECGLSKLIKFYENYDNSILYDSFREASNILIRNGKYMSGNVYLNIIAKKYIGKCVSQFCNVK